MHTHSLGGVLTNTGSAESAEIKHDKDFDLLVVPRMGHGSGGAYGDHKRYDFFSRHLLGVNPPEWKALEDAMKPRPATTHTASGEEDR